MKKDILLTLLLLFAASLLPAQTLLPQTPRVNGTVYTTAVKGDTLYLGGEFTKVYNPDSSSAYSAIINNPTNSVNGTWEKPDGRVNKVCSDGKKGFYISGEFSKVGDSLRSRLAHIDSNGRVTSQLSALGLDAPAQALFYRKDTLMVSGFFTQTGNITNNTGLALFDTSGNAKRIPKVSGTVYMIVSDSNGGWFIGGNFTHIGDSARKHLAHVDSNGVVTRWNTLIEYTTGTATVRSLLYASGKLYIGGFFNRVNGQSRLNLACVLLNGTVTSWNPQPSQAPYVMMARANTLYIGGPFTSVNSTIRNNIAAVDLVTGNLLNWNPNANGTVNAMAFKDSVIYIGGTFSTVGGQARNRFAAIDEQSGTLTNLNLAISGTAIYAIQVRNNTLFIAGLFTRLGTTNRQNLASYYLLTDSIGSLNVTMSGSIKGMNIIGGKLYICGDFMTLGAVTKRFAAALDTSSGALLSWNPGVSATTGITHLYAYKNLLYMAGDIISVGGTPVSDRLITVVPSTGNLVANRIITNSGGAILFMQSCGDTLYLAGYFTSINGQLRKDIAAVSLLTYTTTSWNPTINSLTSCMYFTDTSFYIGGGFSTVNGQTRNRCAAFSKSTGALLSWNPNVAANVESITGAGNKIFLGGNVRVVGGQARNYVAAVDAVTGAPFTWAPVANNLVHSLAMSGNKLYVGGEFTSMAGQARNYIAVFDTSGVLLPIDHNASGNVNGFSKSGDNVFAFGEFSIIGGQSRNNLAAISINTGNALSWKPDANGIVYSIAENNNVVYAGGAFTSAGGQNRSRIAALDANTGQATSWNPSADNIVQRLKVHGNRIYAGGYFTNIGGQNRSNLAALDMNSGLATGWNPACNDVVNAILPMGSNIYIGGAFTAVGSTVRNRLACIDTAGVLLSWNPNASDMVYDLAGDDKYVYACGTFLNVSSTGRTRIAKIDRGNGVLSSWNPTYNGVIRSMCLWGNTLYTGGAFAIVNGSQRLRLAAVDTGTADVLGWDPIMNNTVYTMSISNNTLAAGGIFTMSGVDEAQSLSLLPLAYNPPLPVKLLSFSGSLSDNQVLLSWHTASEINNDKFVIERSFDKVHFESIGEVKGNGNSQTPKSYRYTDPVVTQGTLHYYRLKQTDYDGQYTYSQVINIHPGKEQPASKIPFLIYPNPSSQWLTIEGLEQEAAIYDMTGAKHLAIEQNGTIDISVLKNGVYFIRSGSLTQKFVKY